MTEASVFISYSRGDRELARGIKLILESAGMQVWIDEGELLAGDSLIQRISEAVGNADFLVALVSENSIDSNWCQKEISLAVTDGINSGRTKAIPVRVGDVEMPRALADVLYLDFDPASAEESASEIVDHIQRHVAASMRRVATQSVLTTPSPAPSSRGQVSSHLDSREKREEIAKLIESELQHKLDGTREAAILVSLVPHSPGSASIDASHLQQLRQDLSGRRVIPTSPYVGWLNVNVGRGKYELDGGSGNGGLKYCGAQLFKDGSGSFAFMVRPVSSLSTDQTFVLNDEVIVAAVLGGLWLLGEHATTRALSVGPFDLRIEIANAEDHTDFQLGHTRRGFGGSTWGDGRTLTTTGSEILGIDAAEIAVPSTGFMVVASKLLGEVFQSFGIAECPQVDLTGRIRIRYWGGDFVESVNAWAAKHGLQVTQDVLPG
jgi:hypothetical protein